MFPAKADLITHPIRSRIITTLMARQLTTQQIADMLPDVPLPSVYRHVRVLSDNGILHAVEEVRVHGALTKVYAVIQGQTHITPEDIANAANADHLRYLTTFLNLLADTFRAYLEQNPQENIGELTRASMEPLYLNEQERKQFQEALNAFSEDMARPSARR